MVSISNVNGFINFLSQGLIKVFTAPLVIGETSITLWVILKIILLFILVVFIVRLLKHLLKDYLLARLKFDASNREAMSTIVSYALGVIAFLVVVQQSGVNLESFAVIVGSLGVGIGFGLQDITKNFISGLTILLEGKIRVGDFVEFGGLSGFVQTISLRALVIRTEEGGDIIVPNSQAAEQQVLNWNYGDSLGRIHVPVGVAYGCDPVLVTELLLSSAYSDALVLHEPPPRVLFIGFGDSSLNFELLVWIKGFDQKEEVTSSLNFLIEYNLRSHDIEIPFPQQDLWLRNPEVLAPIYHRPVKANLGVSPLPIASEPSLPQIDLGKSDKPLAVRHLIKKVSYFAELSEIELRRLIEVGHRKRLNADEVLFREGDAGDAFYLILSGSVDIIVEKINKHLNTLVAGEFFGELSLMLGIPRTATVKAKEEVLLFVINAKGFKRLLQEQPTFADLIVHQLSQNQEELTQRRKQLQEMGLLEDDEGDKNIVSWVRNRIKNLFSLS